jgi:tetratricopeptide (TPR) repeat protein
MSLIDVKPLQCPGCGASVAPGQPRCQFCGTTIPQDEQPGAQPDAAPVVTGHEDIVDYYALLGITRTGEPFTEEELQTAALTAQKNAMLNQYMDEQQRKKVVEEIEIGGWILTDRRARNNYDGILMSLNSGNFRAHHLTMLSSLQEEARRELGLESQEDTSGDELLQQGIGYQSLGMHKEAAAVLKQAVELMPDSAEAHYRYARSVLGDDSAMSKSPHELRQAALSFKAAAAINPALTDATAYEAMCNGLLARENGDTAQAKAELRRAVDMNSDLAMAWRGLAALALQEGRHDDVMDYCRRALLKNPQDEQSYMLLVASCWRSGKRDYARDAAGRIARLRGRGWNADRVMKEILF